MLHSPSGSQYHSSTTEQNFPTSNEPMIQLYINYKAKLKPLIQKAKRNIRQYEHRVHSPFQMNDFYIYIYIYVLDPVFTYHPPENRREDTPPVNIALTFICITNCTATRLP